MVVGKNEESRNLGVLLGLRDFFLSQVVGHPEGGAGLGGELVVAVDGGLREVFPELMQEGSEGVALLGGAGVLGGAPVFGKASDVADAYAVGIVTLAMGSCLVEGAADVDAAIAIDDVVIAYLAETSGAMPAVDVGNGVVTSFGGGTAMDDDLGDLSHRFFEHGLNG